MAWITCINITMLWICFLFYVPMMVYSIDKELPSFEELPPPIQYFSTSDLQIDLRCRVWPSHAKIQFVVSTKKQWHSPDDLTKGTSIAPLDRDAGELVGGSGGHLRISNQAQLKKIQDQDIHCLAGTEFATVLSRPFRLTPAGMSEFGGAKDVRTVTKDVLRGNVAFIDCYPPESLPKAEVRFKFNDVFIQDGGKYRVVHWSEGRRVSLLIRNVQESDDGLYQCTATNAVTGQIKTSPQLTRLRVEIPSSSVSPSIVMPISGRENGALQISARQGSNVTLFCVMRGAPPPSIKIFNYNNDLTKDPRYSVDNSFGLLHIRNVQPIDAGSYICSDTYLTSSAMFKVIEPLNITSKPRDVVLESLTGDAQFTCIPSKPTVTVAWYFNGRPIPTTYNSTTIIVSPVNTNSLGLYQCVLQDPDEWVSAAATLSIRSYNLISRPSAHLIGRITPPITQNVDSDGQVLSAPEANRIFDNLAVFVRWKLTGNNLGNVRHYVMQIAHFMDDTKLWSPNTVTVQEKITKPYFYVTDRYVQPQKTYKFRIHAFFDTEHTLTSIWSNPVVFMNMGLEAPVIEEIVAQAPNRLFVRWSYQSKYNWPVDTFRILFRQVVVNASESTKKFSKHFHKDIPYSSMNVSIDNLEPGASYQLVIFGLHTGSGVKTTTKFSESRSITLPASDISTEPLPSKPPSKFFSGLWESWKSNKVLYGSLFALTGLMLLIMFLLLLLCLCRQRRFRSNKGMGSTNAFPYNYKEVSKTSSAVNNNSSTLQIPTRMPQHSSQLALQQYQQHNNNSLDRRNNDTSSQIYRAGSVQAMETASLVTDLYGHNYMHGAGMPMGGGGHMQHPSAYQGFSTLQPQGNYPGGGNHRSMPQYHHQHYLTQQQQQHHHVPNMGSMMRENPTGDSNRDSIIDQSMEMAPRNMAPNQQQLMMMQQNQEHQQQQRHQMAAAGYYNQRQGAMSPQMMLMMMGSQQSLVNTGNYRRSNSQNYSMQSVETPIAINAGGHQMYQMDQVLVDSSGRPLSPQYHYMQQQQQQQHPGSHHMSQMHPSMMDMYNQPHAFSRPMAAAEYQQSLNRQQYRRSDSGDCVTHEPGYSYLPTPHGAEMVSSRQHTLNSLPEQPHDNNNHDHHHQQPQHDSPGPNLASTGGGNNNSSGRHHHRRKTRSRQANNPEPNSLERSQVMGNHNDMPPMLAPRSKLPYSEHQGIHRLSGHDMNTIDSHDNAINDCNSESNTAGAVSDNFDPPLQYSAHYDTSDSKYRRGEIDLNDNEAAPSNSLLIDNLPRVRDVSEYGIPVNNNNISMKQAPVPPLKSTSSRHHPLPPNNGYGLECNPDYYSSATSSDRSGPSPPPKYAPHGVVPSRSDEMYMRDQIDQMYYHGDTHC